MMRILLRILAVVSLYLLWRSLVSGLQKGSRQSKKAGTPASRWLVKDPVCDTYVPQNKALALKTGSGVVYFCSDACRRKHLECTT